MGMVAADKSASPGPAAAPTRRRESTNRRGGAQPVAESAGDAPRSPQFPRGGWRRPIDRLERRRGAPSFRRARLHTRLHTDPMHLPPIPPGA